MALQGRGACGGARGQEQEPASVGAESGAQTGTKDIAAQVLPERIAERYAVRGVIGRGGAAVVYEVLDEHDGRTLALKRLNAEPRAQGSLSALFEREYHTLAQLAHPSVIEVFEYGLDAEVPYYTMELLSGGDLRDRSPMPWRTACALIHDVCSSLSLLHSRKLVHRDISPRNVRITESGRAKLIDFGAMTPMGLCQQIVGTPPFVPPEALYRAALDGRTDLYALGATLYYALTRRMAYPARDFDQLTRAWANKPAPPSAIAADVPAALDTLVMDLIGLQPAVRPASAYEVMQRLCTIAELDCDEGAAVSAAYLATPVLVGRELELTALRGHLRWTRGGRGTTVILEGASGSGRSRMLDACALEAKTLGLSVLRAQAKQEPLATALDLAAQALDAASRDTRAAIGAEPRLDAVWVTREQDAQVQLRALDELTQEADRAHVQEALGALLVGIGQHHGLALMVDDVERCDHASVAVLATVANEVDRLPIFLAATREGGAAVRAAAAFGVLQSYASTLTLEPLAAADTHALLTSVFGDVPNVASAAQHIHPAAQGLPRAIMELAEQLVSTGAARYARGAWTLQDRFDSRALPSSVRELFVQRIASLSPLARVLAHTQALAVQHALERSHYLRIAREQTAASVDAALTELLRAGVLVSDGLRYRFSSHGVASLLLHEQSDEVRRTRHRVLATVYAECGASAVLIVHHMLAAGMTKEALERFLHYLEHDMVEGREMASLEDPWLSVQDVAALHARMLEVGLSHGASPRALLELRRWLMLASVPTENAYFHTATPALRAQLEHDSGLDIYEALDGEQSAAERIGHALGRAYERYQTTPEAARGFRPDEAIRALVQYAVCSLAIGTRTIDPALIASIPRLLAPFAPLSPVVDLVHRNVLSTIDSSARARYVEARERWLAVYESLGGLTGADLKHVSFIRAAVAYGISLLEASLGMPAALRWAEVLDADPMQRVNAMYLRRVLALHRGSTDEAERYRKQAELLAAQSSVRQMFVGFVQAELSAFARARDLVGVQSVRTRIDALAEQAASWKAYQHLAQGYFSQICGEDLLALKAFDQALALATPSEADPARVTMCYAPATSARIETLITLGRQHEAVAFGEQALALWHAMGLGAYATLEIERSLALARARAGDLQRAAEQLEALAARQVEVGVSGLNLGATYEARTRVAIWAADNAAIEAFGKLTAREYRHGRGSALGARYERLMDEARSTGLVLPGLSEVETGQRTLAQGAQRASAAKVAQRLGGARTATERAARSVELLCEAKGAGSAHLFLHDGTALSLSASHGVDAPGPGLRAQVSTWLDREINADETKTAVLTGASTEECLRDGDRAFVVFALTCSVKDTVCVVGALAVEHGEHSEHSEHSVHSVAAGNFGALLEAVAEHWLRTGEVAGRSVPMALPKTER